METGLRRVTRNAHLWLPQLLRARWRSRGQKPATDVWVAIADHFEPYWGRPNDATARARVEVWRRLWPEIASRHTDSDGHAPCYTFFYPQEEYCPQLLEPLAEMTRAGIADVEVHLHHDGEGERDFVDRITWFTKTLQERHGLLRQRNGRPVFGFIHGNWALDNSHPEGRFCGLNNELTLLRDVGCYADFTLPAVPDAAQAGLVNAIYWAKDDRLRPRSHATGVPVVPGSLATGDLMIVTGPLGLNWHDRPAWKPRIETGELSAVAPPSLDRARLWVGLSPRVGSHVFIKLFAHGAPEKNSQALLLAGLDQVFADLGRVCEEKKLRLRFVSTWRLWLAIEALREGRDPASAPDRSPS